MAANTTTEAIMLRAGAMMKMARSALSGMMSSFTSSLMMSPMNMGRPRTMESMGTLPIFHMPRFRKPVRPLRDPAMRVAPSRSWR